MTDAARFRDAVRGPDSWPMMPIRAGAVITAVDMTTAPWRVKVRFSDGTVTDWILCAGWYKPVVNDVVMVGLVDRAPVCLGGYAGSVKVALTETVLATPSTPAPPPSAPPPPPTVRTANISAVSSSTWSPSWGGWRTDDDDVRQGGTSAQRGFWFYGTAIAAAKGSGTIVSGTVYVERRDSTHGVSGAANVRIGTHGNATRPGSGASAHANVQAYNGRLLRGQDDMFALSAAHIAALNAGAHGLGLEPGVVGTAVADYLIALGVGATGASGQLSLVIQG